MDQNNESAALEPEVIQALKEGRKIEAIKRLRQSRGLDLKDAKNLVDQYCLNHPDDFPQAAKSSPLNAIILCALVLLVFGVYKYFAG